MSIHCKICNREFKSLITSTHLAQHKMKTSEYVILYGKDSLSSPEYRTDRSKSSIGVNNPNFGNTMSEESRKLISDKNSGKSAWNKNMVLEDTTNYKIGSQRREERYKSGELSRPVHVIDDEIRKKISAGVSKYAEEHKQEMSDRGVRAARTKESNGHDLAFFRGRVHSDESRRKISESSKRAGQIKHERTIIDTTTRINDLNYSLLSYNDKNMTVECNQCKNHITYTLQMFHPAKISKEMCSVCYPPLRNKSKCELEIYEFIKSYIPEVISNYREKYHSKEIDIFIPSINIGIEYNGLYWHSEKVLESTGNSRTKDFEKMNEFNNKGIRVIQIFEDEWHNSPDIVKSRLLHILKLSKNETIYARKCEIREITSLEASTFCSKYHIQGRGRSNVRCGLFYNDKLVSVMTFSKNNLSRKISNWELNRFCVADYNIPGAASRLFSYFIKTYLPESVVTYADRRWSAGNLYAQIGFKFDKNTSPGYWYFLPNTAIRIHRFSLRKNKDDDQNLTEYENRNKQGYLRIWDCGNSKWIWTR